MEVYPALLGVGYIVGPKIASYMFTGSLIGWMVIMPVFVLVSHLLLRWVLRRYARRHHVLPLPEPEPTP